MLFGANATLDQVRAIPTPEATESWQPVGHHEVLDVVGEILDRRGLRVEETSYALDRDGQRLFSQFSLSVPTSHQEVAMQIGVGNSLDKSLSARIVGGEQVKICSNGMWLGEFTVRRKHTSAVRDHLPCLFDDAIGRYVEQFAERERVIAHLKGIEVNEQVAALAIMRATEQRIIASTQTTKVWNEFRNPSYPEFRDPVAWNLQQAFTTVQTHDRRMDLNDSADCMSRLNGLFSEMFPEPALN